MLELNQLSKGYQQPDGFLPVLRDVSATLQPGESAALLGESGSGKSTLLHLIAGLDQPDSGEVWLSGRKLPDNTSSDWNHIRREAVSLVFQDFHLIPTLNVSDNVHLQARLAGRVDAGFISSLIDRLGLTNLLNRMPHELSGGQQQRVAIARALAHRPALVLADEPTGNLDENTAKDVLALFVDCVQQANSSLLMVTHSAKMAEFLDHRWHLSDGTLHVA
jgi:putative ABC transport system ATP-binding protein